MHLSPVILIMVIPCFLIFPQEGFQVYNYYRIQQACVLMKPMRGEHITHTVISMHLIPMCYGIDSEVVFLIFTFLNGQRDAQRDSTVYLPSFDDLHALRKAVE